MANTTLVSSTRPSGIMATTPATQPRMASARSEWDRSWLTMSSTLVGSNNHWT